MEIVAEKYEIITELGIGGMGAVFLVRHVDLGVNYALKLLNRSLSEDERFIERFKREASVLLKFTHAGTAQLRDFGRTEDGLYYLAMDYCNGMTLKDVLECDGPYPVKTALRIVLDILDVLERAHAQGILHLDIKPANVMIEEQPDGNNVVRVLDFGTALLKKQLNSEVDGTAMGTPCYMSPEQASADLELDHTSDIYSVGILLHELLTGDVPFEGESVIETLLMQITQPPSPFAVKYGIPEVVEPIVFRAMEKQPGRRYQSAKEFADACRELLDGPLSLEANRPLGPKTEALDLSQMNVEGGEKGEEVRILCLDDNEMILHILQHILEKEGYTVYTAIDCSGIHGYIFNDQVDLLISDINMPGMPGTKICKMLKSQLEDLKIVFFSNIPERELKKHTEENSADGWISKHTKPDEWLSEINRVIKT